MTILTLKTITVGFVIANYLIVHRDETEWIKGLNSEVSETVKNLSIGSIVVNTVFTVSLSIALAFL